MYYIYAISILVHIKSSSNAKKNLWNDLLINCIRAHICMYTKSDESFRIIKVRITKCTIKRLSDGAVLTQHTPEHDQHLID